MASEVRKFDVLIASPSDTKDARDAIEGAIHDWNTHRSDAENVVLRPLRWETGSIPVYGRGDPQSVINAQLVDKADIVFAVFFARLGSPTSRAASGTAEEINRAANAGKCVHIYFSEASIPHDVDTKQLDALRKFRRQLNSDGLIGTFSSADELRDRVRNALEYDLNRLVRLDMVAESGTSADVGQDLDKGGASVDMAKSAVPADHDSSTAGGGDETPPEEQASTRATERAPSKNSPDPQEKSRAASIVVPVAVALIAALATIVAALIGASAGSAERGGGSASPTLQTSIPSPSKSPWIPVLDLSWTVVPSSAADDVTPGLAVYGGKRYSSSFSHTYCDPSTIDATMVQGFASIEVSKFQAKVGAVGADTKIARILTRELGSQAWILVDEVDVKPGKLVDVSDDLPADVFEIRLAARGGNCKEPIVWLDPKVS